MERRAALARVSSAGLGHWQRRHGGSLQRIGARSRRCDLRTRAAKVTTNFFLVGLSSVDADVQSNLRLLKERDWLDIPIVYDDGRRAIPAIEKGTPGKEAF